jgi:1,4-alpha-glucan branching enzyme
MAGHVGSVVFVLHTHLPWVLGHGRWPHGEDWLYEAAGECYLRILRLLQRLETEGRTTCLTIGITPVLLEMLASPRFRQGFETYLDERRALAERDSDAFRDERDAHGAGLAAQWARFYGDAKRDFLETHAGDLVGAFRGLQERGRIEILTSAATHGYLPLLGRDESLEGQIRTAVASYRRHFRRRPRGIWLPECAYRPASAWSRPVGPGGGASRPGIETFLGRHGLRFFFVDTHLVAGGVPIGSYEDRFAEPRLDALGPPTGLSPNDVHGMAAGRRRLAVFARDPRSSVQVWSADYGYPGDGAYLEFHRKRGPGGLRYWRITDRRLPLDAKIPYEPEAAAERVRAHAAHFAGLVRETLREHEDKTGRRGVVVAPFDTELFGHWWFEGPSWLEAVLRDLEPHVAVVTASEYLEDHPPRSSVRLPEGSWGQGGQHWVWLNDDTKWVWERVYRAEDDFLEAIQASRRGDSPLVARILRQLARELLLLEASDWPFLITTGAARDYAEGRARFHTDAFERLRACLAQASRGGFLSLEDEAWLADLEARDSPFPEVEPDWWSLEIDAP